MLRKKTGNRKGKSHFFKFVGMRNSRKVSTDFQLHTYVSYLFSLHPKPKAPVMWKEQELWTVARGSYSGSLEIGPQKSNSQNYC